MKMKKTIAMTLAAVMSLAAMPVLSANAESAYALGDVDMDGVITGHDTAMVSRHIFDDSYTLTDEEMALADVNQDGAVDKLDNEWIHANEVYMIGEIYDGWGCSIESAYITLVISSYQAAGGEFKPSDSAPMFDHDYDVNSGTINTVSYNLMDVNADGEITIEDAAASLLSNSRRSVATEKEYYFVEGRYDLFPDAFSISSRPLDRDGMFGGEGIGYDIIC